MASKRRIKKKKIKEDQLVTMTVKATQLVQEYFTQVVVGVLILVVAVAAVVFTTHTRRNAARDSERDFSVAMSQYNVRDVEGAATAFEQIADRYGGHRAGKFSHYFLAKSLLSQKRYEEAMAAFDEYTRKADANAPFRYAAEIGKALCHEGLHNFTAAAELLEQLSQTLEPEDPRRLEVLFQAGTDYDKAGSRDKALEMFRVVADEATGPLRDRAAVSVAILE
jgi:hypothetical protein